MTRAHSPRAALIQKAQQTASGNGESSAVSGFREAALNSISLKAQPRLPMFHPCTQS